MRRTALDLAKKECPDTNLLYIREAMILKREERYKEAIELLELNTYPQDPISIMLATNQLSHLYDYSKEYDKAFNKFKEFNDKGTKIYQITNESKNIYLNKIKQHQQIFTKDFVKNLPTNREPKEQKEITFLYSFPRSGTTLLQHILNSHPEIHATEEIPAIPIIEGMLSTQTQYYPSSLTHLNPTTINQLQSHYLEIHRSQIDWEEKNILIDKYPMGTLNVGLSHFLFPNAKFIFAARHPCDCILSSYFQFFTPNEGMIHTYNLADTVNLYCKMMDLWKQYEDILPIQTLVIKYEDIIEYTKPTINKTLEFIGSSWNESVLDYHKKAKEKGDIRTPSYSQISQNIYSKSVYRWKNYFPHIKPFLNQLKPYAEWLWYEL